MNNTASQVKSLIQTLKTGSPRAAHLAGKELIGFGSAAEAPLIHLLKETGNADKIRYILNVLQEVKISDPISVDFVVLRLSHEKNFVRSAAAHCLLATSPKLRRHLVQIRAILAREKDERVRAILQKLLDRYPEKSSNR